MLWIRIGFNADPDSGSRGLFYLYRSCPSYTGEANLQPTKRTSSTSKHEISSLFLFLWVILAPPVSESVFLLRNQNQCESGSTTTLHWWMRCGFCRWQKYIAKLQINCNVYRPESREIAACRGASSGRIHRQVFR